MAPRPNDPSAMSHARLGLAIAHRCERLLAHLSLWSWAASVVGLSFQPSCCAHLKIETPLKPDMPPRRLGRTATVWMATCVLAVRLVMVESDLRWLAGQNRLGLLVNMSLAHYTGALYWRTILAHYTGALYWRTTLAHYR
jgi:hypothetical protein